MGHRDGTTRGRRTDPVGDDEELPREAAKSAYAYAPPSAVSRNYTGRDGEAPESDGPRERVQLPQPYQTVVSPTAPEPSEEGALADSPIARDERSGEVRGSGRGSARAGRGGRRGDGEE